MMKNADTQFMDAQLIDWVRLIRTDKIGPVTFWQLLRQYGSAAAVLEALPKFTAYAANNLKICSKSQAIQEIEAHERQGLKIIAAYQPEFPEALRLIFDCPPILSVYGRTDIFNRSIVGIVGARNASLMGRQFAEKIAQDLGSAGWTVASGLARGIDRYAHQGSLKTGTIAVIAGGVDIIYPPEHEKLYHAISENGAVISEMPLSLHPGATHFPRRNRIISGLSKGVAVIEAAQKSGSLITARYAAEQNRDLFAVPGSPYDPRCRGTNDLLKQGATLIEGAQDILNVLACEKIALEEPVYPFQPYGGNEEHESREDMQQSLRDLLLNDLSVTPVSVDHIIAQYACRPQDVLAIILDLELAGMVQRYANGMVSRLYPEVADAG